MDYGIKVTKAGDNVLSTIIKNQRFNTGKGAFKMFKSADATLTTNGSGDGSTSVAHNLDYAPAFFVMRKGTARWDFLTGSTEYSNAFFPVGSPNYYVKNDPLHHGVHVYADGDNINIQVDGGTPSITMNFRVYILVDKSEAFSDPDNVSLVNDYGFKVSKEGASVLSGKEYEMGFSSKYKILQGFNVSNKSETLTLPQMNASYHDQDVEEATYVDFEHGLGYPPLFMAFFESPLLDDKLVAVPLTLPDGLEIFTYGVSGFCDATRIRIYFWRFAYYNPITGVGSNWDAETITVKVHVFAENLLGDTFPPA